MDDEHVTGLSLRIIVEALFTLDDEWRSIHRNIWSLRNLAPVGRVDGDVDFAQTAWRLRALQERLAAVPRASLVVSSDPLSHWIEDYRYALASSMRLLQGVCEVINKKVMGVERISSQNRNEAVSRYLNVRDLTMILRDEVSESIPPH